jgi:hypothetical protein
MKKNIIGVVGLILVGAIIVCYFIAKNLFSTSAFSMALSNLTQQTSSTNEIILDLNLINSFTHTTEKLINSKFIKAFLPPIQREFLNNLQPTLPDLQSVLDALQIEDQKWILLFQNSNEIRATGGFIGSYAIVDIKQGKIVSITTEDIYDADGQFTGFVEAPPGVKEYLSSGNGLRLPDANWQADTGASARDILPFFAYGNKTNIKGIIFINLDFTKKLLEFLGPIEVSDYNTIVTQDNVDEVLRSRRDEFFPGSVQKKHLLSLLLTQIKIRIFSLKPEEIINLAKLVGEQIDNHNLQFYSINPIIDNIFVKYQMRQIINLPENSDYLYLVESNVGINKANKNVTRNVHISKDQSQIDIQVRFDNQNIKPTQSKLTDLTQLTTTPVATQENKPADHLAYINYQRVLVPQDWQLQSIKYQGVPLTKIGRSQIEINNFELQQIGILITVFEENTGLLEISFIKPNNFDQIYIQKQPGIPATSYFLEYNQAQQEYLLINNESLTYP